MTMIATDLVPIEQMRTHLLLDEGDTAQDANIQLYANAALAWCLWYCDEPKWQAAADVPDQVRVAMLLVLTDFFEHRSKQSEIQLYSNSAAEMMLFSCRNWYGGPLPEAIDGNRTA